MYSNLLPRGMRYLIIVCVTYLCFYNGYRYVLRNVVHLGWLLYIIHLNNKQTVNLEISPFICGAC
jgi:NADH:ubiquinone oxidoreductase subunit E